MNEAILKIEALLESLMTPANLEKAKNRPTSTRQVTPGGEYKKPIGKDYKAGKTKYPPSRI